MSSEFEQGERGPNDGPISVARTENGIVIGHSGRGHGITGGHLTISEYNAARILACLAQVLGVRLNREDARRIRL